MYTWNCPFFPNSRKMYTNENKSCQNDTYACPSDTLKHLGSSTHYDQPPYQVWWASVKALSRYRAEMAFTLKVAATLTFDLVTPKSKGVFYTLWLTSLPSLVNLGQSILKISCGNGFYMESGSNPDIWPCDPKNNKGLLHLMTNLPTKFGKPRSKHCQDMALKWFWH